MLSIRKHLLQQTLWFSPNNCLVRPQASLFYSFSHISPKLQVYESLKTQNKLYFHWKLQSSQLNYLQLSSPCACYSTNSAAKMDKQSIKNDMVTKSQDEAMASKTSVSYRDKLKQAMAQYGSTVIVFHIAISLMSLGTCYILVTSGLDVSSLLEKFGLSEKSINKLASSSGTFAAAYLIHKVLAPVRLSITLTCTPFIVRYLRKAGLIKKALPKVNTKK